MKITYEDKVALNENLEINDINKIKADDMNMIKNVVNANQEDVGNIANLKTTDISNIVNAINENVDNIEITKGTILYTSDSGELEAVTLSDDKANYKYLEIYCGVAPEKINCIKMLTNVTGCILFCVNTTTNDIGIYVNIITLSNNTISRGLGVIRWFGGDNSKTNQVKIFKVVGYK